MEGDRTTIILEGAPYYEDNVLVEGERFHLSGGKGVQAREGVELSRGVGGLLVPSVEYRYDTSADQPGSTFVDKISSRREFQASVNIFGEDGSDFRNVWERWTQANFGKYESKLWFLSPGREDRYAFVRPSTAAGTSALDVDPSIQAKVEGLEWGWVSDYPNLFGDELVYTRGDDNFISVWNPSDVGGVYPRIFLPGPGKYTLSFEAPSPSEIYADKVPELSITTPTLTADETIRINLDPLRKTYTVRNNATGQVRNLWYTLVGKRPKWELVPRHTSRLKVVGGSGTPEVRVVPQFGGVL